MPIRMTVPIGTATHGKGESHFTSTSPISPVSSKLSTVPRMPAAAGSEWLTLSPTAPDGGEHVGLQKERCVADCKKDIAQVLRGLKELANWGTRERMR